MFHVLQCPGAIWSILNLSIVCANKLIFSAVGQLARNKKLKTEDEVVCEIKAMKAKPEPRWP